MVNKGLEALFLELEFDRYVASVNALLEALDCSSYVSIGIDKLALVELLEFFLLLVWEDDIASESLGHEQIFTKGTRSSSQDFIWVSGDDGAKSEDEAMDHLLVEEESCHGVRDRVLS